VRLRSFLFIVIVLALGSGSCKEKGIKDIDQGEIHYSIEYQGDLNSSLKDYMPKSLVVSFKDDKVLFEISAPIGNTGILNLSNPDEDIFDTYFTLFALKYAYSAKPGEIHPGFEAMEGIRIKKTQATSVICGFNCKSAEVIMPNDPSRVIQIWYTDEIDIKNPNLATPFNEIDGVLMSFFFFIGPSEMHFTAENVYKKEIPDDTFERRQKYMWVSREQINGIISKMLSL
jgi:hypothetical protein